MAIDWDAIGQGIQGSEDWLAWFWHNTQQHLQPQQQQQPQQSQQAAQSELAGYVNPFGSQAKPQDTPSPVASQAQIQQMIVTAAAKYHIDPSLALSIAYHESGLNPYAVGDNGTSFGIFQLHQGGLLGNMTPEDAFNPQKNIDTALANLAQVIQQNPNMDMGTLAAMAQRPANPQEYANSIDQLYKSFSSGQAPPSGVQVPDGSSTTTLYQGNPLLDYYNMIDSVYSPIFGHHINLALVKSMQAAGIQSAPQVQSAINGMTLPGMGMSVGQYQNMKSSVDQYSRQLFGRAAPNNLITELAQQGNTNDEQIHAWFMQHSASQMPQDDYKQIWDAANQYTQAYSGNVPHPSQVAAIYTRLTQKPPEAPTPPVVLPQKGVTHR